MRSVGATGDGGSGGSDAPAAGSGTANTGGEGHAAAGTGTSEGNGGATAGGATAGGATAGGGQGGTSGTGTGDAAGTGGTEAGTAGDAGGGVEPIDDVEHAGDQFAGLPANSSAFFWGPGFLGNWFVYAPLPDRLSGDAQTADIVPPRGDSARAYRVQDADRESGVDLYAQLDHPLNRAMDLSQYEGITFWAKLGGASGRLVVALTPGGERYFDAADTIPSIELTVSSEWEQFVLPFDAFGSDGSAVASFDFVAGQGGEAFDLWVDDLAFLCRGACPTWQ